MRPVDRVGVPPRSPHAIACDRWDPAQRRTNGSSISCADRVRARPLPRVRQPLSSGRGDPSPWLAVGITVLGTIIGFFVVYRWPAPGKQGPLSLVFPGNS